MSPVRRFVASVVLVVSVILSTADLSRASSSSQSALTVTVDPHATLRPISPLILGVSGDVDSAYIRDVGITLNSWGGNPSTRFNYKIGHAWNAGADWEYRNGNYGSNGDAAARFVRESLAAGAQVRLAVPTLGWVAKDDHNDTCSFPLSGGGCGNAAGANCEHPGPVADPLAANVPSTAAAVTDWLRRLVQDQHLRLNFVAMDNEPELWGATHYDVHPACSTYEEILEHYLAYATAVRAAVPKSRLAGPVMCCWYSFWRTAPGPSVGPKTDFLTWFLKKVRAHDRVTGQRSLDVLDVHYYPQSDVFNDRIDSSTAARRLRGTRSLFDAGYSDESWINSKIRLIPRLRETIERAYPGTALAISEWNFGADGSMNGALAIADVLGIYGRDGVDVAAYWRSPKRLSPGYFAFKMYGNYNSKGGRFSGVSVSASSPRFDVVSTYGAIDPSTGTLRIMLINKSSSATDPVRVALRNFNPNRTVAMFRYSDEKPLEIVTGALDSRSLIGGVALPPSSITLLELAPAGR